MLEPLNREETYLINTVDEAMEIIDEIGNEDLGFLLDSYHFMRENEKLTNIDERIIRYISHLHIASKDKRTYLIAPDQTYVSIFNALRKASYKDLSFESKKALIILKELIYNGV